MSFLTSLKSGIDTIRSGFSSAASYAMDGHDYLFDTNLTGNYPENGVEGSVLPDLINDVNTAIQNLPSEGKNTADYNTAAIAEAEKNRQFQHDENTLAWERQMEASNTAVSRYMQQLSDNGINPILAVSNGNLSASTPSSSGASGSVASLEKQSESKTDTVKAVANIIASMLTSASKYLGKI